MTSAFPAQILYRIDGSTCLHSTDILSINYRAMDDGGGRLCIVILPSSHATSGSSATQALGRSSLGPMLRNEVPEQDR